jgi:hypothetical protein
MRPVGSRGSLSLLSVMKVTVSHFVSDSHKGMTALIVMLPSNGCCCNFTHTDMIWQLGRKIIGLQLGEMDVDWRIACCHHMLFTTCILMGINMSIQ